MRVRHDAHEIGVLGQRVAAADAEVGDARRHHRKIAAEVDHVHHRAWRLLVEPDADPARIGFQLSGADIVHLSRDIAACRNHPRRIGRGDCRPHPRHEAADERGPRLAVVANRRHPESDAVRILKATAPVVRVAEAVAAAMLPNGLLHGLPRQMADQRVVHDFAIAREELHRAEPEICGAIQRKHDVAVDVVAVGAELRRLGLLEHDVGGTEILLEGRGVRQRRERGWIGGISLRLAGGHPCPQHGDLRWRRRLRPLIVEIAFDLRRRHPPGVDLLEPDVDPLHRIVIGEEAERTGLPRAVALLALGMEKREDIPAERRRGWGNGRCGHRSLRPVERAAGGLRPRFADLTTGDQISNRICEFGLGIAGGHHAADLVAVVDPA